MHTIRSKLFVSVGIILIVVALLNYFLPEILVQKNLNRASNELEKFLEGIEDKLKKVSTYLITYRLVESAAGLEDVTQSIEREKSQFREDKSIYETAVSLATYNPQISFVEVQNQEGQATVTPGTATLYSPSYSQASNGELYLQFPKNKGVYLAKRGGNVEDIFFLERVTKYPRNFEFRSLEGDKEFRDLYDKPVRVLYADMVDNQSRWFIKVELLSRLVSSGRQGFYDGVLKVNPQFTKGYAILTDEVLSKPILENVNLAPKSPFLHLRRIPTGEEVEIVRILQTDEGSIAIGFSLTATLIKIANLIHRPIGVVKKGEFSLFYRPDGTEMEVDFKPDQKNLTIGKVTYISSTIDLEIFDLVVLTPKSESVALQTFLEKLGDSMTDKISVILMGATLASLLIAFLFLARISKRITRPIAILAKASDDLGQGKYEGITLPDISHRKDEVATFTKSFENLIGALRDREKVHGVLNKVVSKEISEEFLKQNVELGGEDRTLTILFSDIRDFTTLSESLSPKDLIAMLNDYMNHMCGIIDTHHGVVDKFVGDEIMVLFGAPLEMENHAEMAVRTAIEMMKRLHSWNEERSKKGYKTLNVGIGIHTGEVCCGNMGAENRLNYTAVGANVNLAARLCSSAKPMQILVSDATYQQPGVKELASFKAVEPLHLKGIQEPVQAFEAQVNEDF